MQNVKDAANAVSEKVKGTVNIHERNELNDPPLSFSSCRSRQWQCLRSTQGSSEERQPLRWQPHWPRHRCREKQRYACRWLLYDRAYLLLSFQRLAEEKGHEAKKEAHKEAAEERGVIGQIGDTISNAYHYVTEKVSG